MNRICFAVAHKFLAPVRERPRLKTFSSESFGLAIGSRCRLLTATCSAVRSLATRHADVVLGCTQNSLASLMLIRICFAVAHKYLATVFLVENRAQSAPNFVFQNFFARPLEILKTRDSVLRISAQSPPDFVHPPGIEPGTISLRG